MNRADYETNWDEEALREALGFLSAFTDYEQKHAGNLKRDSLDLGRMRELAAWFGNPQQTVPVFHIAGSKGKGSTTMILEALLRGQGLRTGRFLSPHLESVTERIALNGTSVSATEFAALTDRLRPLVAQHEQAAPEKLPSFFESITLMAFLAFAEAGLDAAVMETGLGGRLDATNIVEPLVSIITMIDLEHTRVLGDTVAEIAREKAGIIKPGRPVICGQDPESDAGRVIAEIASERGAPLRYLDRDIKIKDVEQLDGMQVFDLDLGGRTLTRLRTPLLGRHQLDNIALAVAALFDRESTGLSEINIDRLARSIEQLALPGRLEVIPAMSGHLNLPCPVILDSAHTPRSMQALAAAIHQSFPNRKRTGVVGFLRDKNVETCLSPLIGLFDKLVIVEPDSPRAMPAAELIARAREVLGNELPIAQARGPEELAQHTGGPQDLMVITGSVYLAGAVRSALTTEGM